MIEVWRVVKGYEEYYISNLGRVRSFKKNGSKILKANKNHRGYLYVRLYENRKPKHFFIHRLVADAFIPNPDNKPQVNHKDGDKSNNFVDNLEWSTNTENQQHAHKTGLKESPMKGRFGSNHNRSKPIIQFTKDGDFVAEYTNAREAERVTGVANPHIASCCKGKYKTAGGFIWKYKEE